MNVSTYDLAHFKLFADMVYDGKGQNTGGDESLRSYSINIFLQMVLGTFDDFEDSRPSPWVQVALSVYISLNLYSGPETFFHPNWTLRSPKRNTMLFTMSGCHSLVRSQESTMPTIILNLAPKIISDLDTS